MLQVIYKHKCEPIKWEGHIYQCKYCLKMMTEKECMEADGLRLVVMSDLEICLYRIGYLIGFILVITFLFLLFR